MDYVTYSSMAIMNIIIGGISALIFAFLVYGLVPTIYTEISIVILPISVVIFFGLLYRSLPKYLIKKRERNIDLFLPYTVNYISSMAVAGISPAEIFESLSLVAFISKFVELPFV